MIRQVSVQVGVAPDTDVAAALQVIEGVVLANPRVLKDVPPVIGVSSLRSRWFRSASGPGCPLTTMALTQAELSRAILEALRANRISLALAQHEVRLLQPQDLNGFCNCAPLARRPAKILIRVGIRGRNPDNDRCMVLAQMTGVAGGCQSRIGRLELADILGLDRLVYCL